MNSRVVCSSVGGACLLLLIGWWFQRRRRHMAVKNMRNKVVLITGASSGLGEACAKVFYQAGCRLILCSRRQDQLERVAQELKKLKTPASSSEEPKVLTIDLAEPHKVPQIIRSAINIYGYIDVVINNAGVSCHGDAIHTQLSVYRQVMNVNFFGQIAVIQAVLESMMPRRSGQIVIVSSVQGKLSIPYRSAYGASKHAIQSYADSLRAELYDSGVVVCVVSPSYIRTDLSMNALSQDGTKYGKMEDHLLRGMSPDYVAQRILQATALHQNDVILGPMIHKLAIYFRNLLPNVLMWVMKGRARSEKHKD